MAADNLVLLVTFVQQAICLVGIILNSAIIWITVKNKNLRNSYGYLLAIYSLSEAIFESSSFPSTVLTLMDTKIPLVTCFYLNGIQATGAAINAAISLLLISIDRLFAALFPMFYTSVINLGGCGKYVCVLVIFSIANSTAMVYVNWLHVLEHTNVSVYCEIAEQMGGVFDGGLYRDLLNFNLIFAYLATIIVYIILGIYLKVTKSTTSSNSQMAHIRKIYKSLATVMCVIFFFYFIGFSATALLVPQMTNDPQAAFLYFRISGQFFLMAGVINAPVLYFCSTEYKNAMNRQFPFLLHVLKVCQNINICRKIINKNSNVIHVQPAAAAMTTVVT